MSLILDELVDSGKVLQLYWDEILEYVVSARELSEMYMNDYACGKSAKM